MHWMGLELSAWEKAGCRPREQITRAVFCCSLKVHGSAGKKEMKIACVNRYCLSVNGRAMMNGPARAPRMQCYLETVDLSEAVHEGENRISILVEAYPSLPCDGNHEAAQNQYRYDRGPMIAVSSDAFPELAETVNWTVRPDLSCTPDGSMQLLSGPTECIRVPEKPEEALPAADLGMAGSNPWGEMLLPEIIDKPIPNLLRKQGAFLNMPTLHVQPDETGEQILEAETLTTAVPAFEIRGGQGAQVCIVYAESFVHEDRKDKWKDIRSDRTGVLKGLQDVIYPRGGTLTWEPLWIRTFRYIRITVTAGNEPVSVRPLGYTEMRYPLQARTAVTSTEKWVNQLYEISRRTLEDCMHDSYVDCPYYEQLMYLMDTRLEAVYTHRLSGDTRLSRQAIRLFAASRTPSGLLQARYPCAKFQIIPEFCLFFLEMLLDDYIQTGDKDFAISYLPVAFGIVRAFEEKISEETGMFTTMGWWEFADWTEEWNPLNGVPAAAFREESALHNLHFAYALKCFASLLKELDMADPSAEMDRLAGRVATAVHHACYDRARQMYREGRTTQQYSQHTQIWAVLCGIAEGDIARNALDHALRDSDVVRCSFCMQFYLFRALEKADMYERTIPLWADWRHLIEQDLTTIPESPGQPRSDCHAWGATPLYEFPAVWLGVNPGKPGWKTIQICPRTDLVRNLSGTCWTPKGPVFVSWIRKSVSSIHLWIQSPPDAETSVCMPDGQKIQLVRGAFDGDVETKLMEGETV